MEQKHSAEPWRVRGGWSDEYSIIYSEGDRRVVVAETTEREPRTVMSTADKRRAAKCVSALAGIDDPAALLRDVRAVLEKAEAATRRIIDWRGIHDDDSNHTFEKIAERFYRDTGMLRPGKDDALGCHTYEQRSEAFRQWCDKHNDAIDAELVAAGEELSALLSRLPEPMT